MMNLIQLWADTVRYSITSFSHEFRLIYSNMVFTFQDIILKKIYYIIRVYYLTLELNIQKFVKFYLIISSTFSKNMFYTHAHTHTS